MNNNIFGTGKGIGIGMGIHVYYRHFQLPTWTRSICIEFQFTCITDMQTLDVPPQI